MITVVDYGLGNLGSIENMLKRINVPVNVTSNLSEIKKASKLLLPGVGKFDAAMNRINDSGLRDVLDEKALNEKIPVLGICLGMQLLTCSSEEGGVPGLGWIKATTKKFPVFGDLKVPHMGWNVVDVSNDNVLIQSLPKDSRFYFVHSYCVHVHDSKHSILKTKYGIEFDSAVGHGNVFGTQFHPEKSHKFGMQLLRNFASI
jgi:glutamine amidotransferase